MQNFCHDIRTYYLIDTINLDITKSLSILEFASKFIASNFDYYKLFTTSMVPSSVEINYRLYNARNISPMILSKEHFDFYKKKYDSK